MPKRYPIELRRDVCKRLLAGASVVALAKETGLSQGTLFRWKKQAFIDAGLAPGVKSLEVDELARLDARSKSSKRSSRSRARRGRSLTVRNRSAQKALPGCRGAEQPGLQRADGLCGR